ncbi:MAG TPA: M12 family metallo-peptidase [Verrucomicrobiae bacterium]|nr:M12 family metallo-peptidase [Verrucomicrobiae bacterium]
MHIASPRLRFLPTPVAGFFQLPKVALVLAVCLGTATAARSQSLPADTNSWTPLTAPPAGKIGAARWVQPLQGALFRLNRTVMRTRLGKARQIDPALARNAGTEVELPMPDGTTARFVVVDAPVMAPELAAKFPEIKTYAGQGIDDPQATVRLDLSPQGFHAQILSPRGAVYVDPAYRGDDEDHVSYYKRDYVKPFDDWKCTTAERGGTATGAGAGTSGVVANKIQSGTALRTYQLAVACTGEYAAYFGGTVTNAMSAIITAVNRVDGVYETELAVRLVLVANNNLLVYTNATTDPYSNNDGVAMLSQNQSTVDAVIGSANYDIGHVFSTGGGGIANLGCVCVAGYKAKGVTGSPVPNGDAFWIDYVAHEMGHQFGANHTFNSETGSCSGNRNPGTAYEPGSGSTIMAYAGICPPNDLQPHSDPYFHTASLDEIQTYLAGAGGGCAVVTATGNNPPTVSAGTTHTIPASTPFMLTATGSDPNGDTLSYCWEERDLGAGADVTGVDGGSGPLFRSLSPVNSSTRYFPKLSSVLVGTNWNQEVLPTTSRTMNFRVTARDNRVGGGGVADADTQVTVASGAGPFVVTAPNTATNWSGSRTVTWNVAGTAGAPINASGVDIYLSTNGGNTFTFLLASNAANSGSAPVVLPNLTSTQARIMVKGTGNIFYDVSDANFNISPGSPTPLVQSVGAVLVAESGSPTNGAVDPYETVTVNWSLSNVGSAPTTNLTATLLTSNGVYYPSAAQNFGVIPAGGMVTRPFTFTPAGTCGGSVTGLLQLVDGTANMGTVAQVFPLGGVQVQVITQSFNNASFITIRDTNSALPYPSTINVSGISGTVSKVTAKINGLTHAYVSDVDVLLVNPGGQGVKLIGGCGDTSAVSGVNLTFDDAATVSLPATGPFSSGTYLPTDYYPSDLLPSPAPQPPYGSLLSTLAGSNPNGQWSLFVADFLAGDSGSISGGWNLTFVISNATSACVETFPTPTLASTTWSNNVVRFAWNAIPGPHYQVQYRTNLATGAWQNLGAAIQATNTAMSITDAVSNAPIRFYRVVVSE